MPVPDKVHSEEPRPGEQPVEHVVHHRERDREDAADREEQE